MKLHAPSAHLLTDQRSFRNHIAQTVNQSASKASGKFPRPNCRVHYTSGVHGYHVIQLRMKWKRDQAPGLVAFASLEKNNEPERGNFKPSSEGEMVKSVYVVSAANQNPKNSDIEVASSVSNSETKGTQTIFEHVVNQGDVLGKLKAVHLHILAMEQWNASRLKLCNIKYMASATNLIHYLALKYLDIGELKEELCSIGLLNLETINPCILASITVGTKMLKNLKSNSVSSKKYEDPVTPMFDVVGESTWEHSDQKNKGEFTITEMQKKASIHREALLGSLRDERTTEIMVTVGNEAIDNETLLSDLLRAGATIFRINCAHGDPTVWSEIIRRAKRSSQMLERPCRILMDLAGPKLRTGSMKPGPSVIKISPKKDASGNVTCPAQVWLSKAGSGSPPAHVSPDAVLFIDSQQTFSTLKVGNILKFYDARGKQRMLKISKKFPVFSGVGFVAECSRTAYVESGTTMYLKQKGRVLVGKVVDVPVKEQFIRLKIGDLLTISRDPCITQTVGSAESTVSATRITCSSSHLFDSVKPGERIAFDDGKIWGVIQGTSISEIVISITHASPNGSKLGSEKSINIPESEIRFEGLTSKDIRDLEFVASHADMVGISFLRDVSDVIVLQQELEKRKLWNLGVVLKIETRSGFEKLPLLLLQAMQAPNPLGVMIARGDLAVECGWERLADIQEEILSICTAAHIPVIWATQVLESLVKTGLPTRAEITDVASGRRASCIMLNKGKYITEAVSTLDSMLCASSAKMMAELKPLVLSSQIHQ